MTKFYDTSTLLDIQDQIFQSEEIFYISNITFIELEEIKSSITRDDEIRYAARHLLNLFNDNPNKYICRLYDTEDDYTIKGLGYPFNNDSKIIMTARSVNQEKEDLIFYTADLSCKFLAEYIGLKVCYTNSMPEDPYKGFIEIELEDEELAKFYNIILPNNDNKYNLLSGQYLIIHYKKEVTDKYRWVENHYEQIQFCKTQSKLFGEIKPKDIYQQLALDSFAHNQITMLRGPAGSGKSLLSMGYLIQQLETGKIDKIVIFCNTVAVRGSAKLGFYPGSKDEKLLDSQIGNFLATKFGSITEVERMIEDGVLVLVPVADCRGMDTTGMKAGVYITEAQNTTVDIMKLILQRIGDDCICIVDGDDYAQVDMKEYSGNNNGMKRLSKVFRGKDFFGEITLQNIYRSKIASTAELM